jgi:hypothetical protein
MSESRPPASSSQQPAGAPTTRYAKYVGAFAVALLVLIAINTLATTPNGSRGVEPGKPLPPFAVPLATGTLNGDANIATRPNEGRAGRVPACSVRGPQVLNICALYERGPVVLVLFVNGGDCPRTLDTLARALPGFAGVQAAAVALRGNRASLRRLVVAHGWSYPVGYDHDGALANLYRVVACPQLTFAYAGGVVQGRPLLRTPTVAVLRARLSLLVSQSRARGWRPTPPSR